jgi:hypothetical protein|tara:strand:- start:77 stop:265 length:189 start_codon:yes stop_codon:yes gene_type:complete
MNDVYECPSISQLEREAITMRKDREHRSLCRHLKEAYAMESNDEITSAKENLRIWLEQNNEL